MLIAAYEAKQTSVKDRLAALRIALEEAARKQSDTEIFMEAIAKYTNLTELNAAILNELIERIEIGSKETVDSEKRQRVRIHYRRAGYMMLNWWELLLYCHPLLGKGCLVLREMVSSRLRIFPI